MAYGIMYSRSHPSYLFSLWIWKHVTSIVFSCQVSTFYGHIKSSRNIFSQPGQGCLFSLMSAVSFIVCPQQYYVLMGHDLYCLDACLYSTKREDLAWGRYYSSFSDRTKWALHSSMENWYHNTQFYLKATKRKQI